MHYKSQFAQSRLKPVMNDNPISKHFLRRQIENRQRVRPRCSEKAYSFGASQRPYNRVLENLNRRWAMTYEQYSLPNDENCDGN